MVGWWIAGVASLLLAISVWRWRTRVRESELLRAELFNVREELRQTNKRIRRLPDPTLLGQAAFDALVLLDREQSVITLNRAARDLFQPAGDPVGKSLITLTRNHELDALAGDALSGSDNLDRQVAIDNRPYRVRALTAPDLPEGLVAIGLQDVTELQRLARARRDMVANISHELRTPITSIRLLVETLVGGALRDKQQGPELLDKIAAETNTLQQMAQELLDLSMIESGRAVVRLVPEPAMSLLDEATGRMREQANWRQVTITCAPCEDFTVLADRGMVLRVLTNLLHNAIKFTPEGGHVETTCVRDGEWLRISVVDDGPGILYANRERVFERFFRGDRARGGPGTGLGLAIAKHIVEAHGGRIWVEEREIGEAGAMLVFTLPLADVS